MKHGLRGLALLALFGLLPARASVTVNFDIGALYNASGGAVQPGSLVLLISDTNHDGFFSDLLAGPSLSVGSFIDGEDDLILASADAALVAGSYRAQGDLSDVSFSGDWGAGDALALVWFDGNPDTLIAGANYGFFTTTSPDDGDLWETPADGSTIALRFLNADAGGSYDPSLFRTDLIVGAVPEPSAYAIMAGALTLVWTLVRRRGARPRLTA